MNKARFLEERRSAWSRFESLIGKAQTPGRLALRPEEVSELSELFRSLCYDLAQVRSHDWGHTVEDYLNELVVRGHGFFYGRAPSKPGAILEFVRAGFPRRLRESWRFLLVAAVLFTVPMLASFFLVSSDPSLAHRVLPGSVLYTMGEMYAPSESGADFSSDRDDAAMAGFYVRHNISIAFRCFALGVFLGLGTVYVLLSNGIQLGTVAGYVVAEGHGDRFFGFVAAHSSYELVAIVVAGTAGLILGHAILAPGPLRRVDALRVRGVVALELALGAAGMLAVAAVIEGFWSAEPFPPAVKYTVAALLWLSIIAYLGLAGRSRPA